MQDDILAIDFGTSNSAAAVIENGRIRRLPIEEGAETLPTAVFFPRRGAMRIGTAAAPPRRLSRLNRCVRPVVSTRKPSGGSPYAVGTTNWFGCRPRPRLMR